jgi:hypothetical protein
MPGHPRARRYASKQLSERMREAGEQLALDFRKATAFEHPGIRGGQREESVRRFLQERLPGGYNVTTGTVFDARDEQSKQLDVLIYRVRDTPFLVPGDPVLVPCESLLAAIEIKSRLDPAKLREGLQVARSIRDLRPFDKEFANARTRGQEADDQPRCLFSVFAFGTDLAGGEDWLAREGARFVRLAQELSVPPQYVDRLIVMDRGIINCAEGRGHDTARSGQSAMQIWFVHLMNHLLREDRRRKEIDIDIYSGRNQWMALPDWPSPAATRARKTPSPAEREASPAPRRQARVTRTQRTRTHRGRSSQP